MQVNEIKLSDYSRSLTNNKQYSPIFLWQICFHVKENIFFIFYLCFDVSYQFQLFLVTRLCAPVRKAEGQKEKRRRILFTLHDITEIKTRSFKCLFQLWESIDYLLDYFYSRCTYLVKLCLKSFRHFLCLLMALLQVA